MRGNNEERITCLGCTINGSLKWNLRMKKSSMQGMNSQLILPKKRRMKRESQARDVQSEDLFNESLWWRGNHLQGMHSQLISQMKLRNEKLVTCQGWTVNGSFQWNVRMNRESLARDAQSEDLSNETWGWTGSHLPGMHSQWIFLMKLYEEEINCQECTVNGSF